MRTKPGSVIRMCLNAIPAPIDGIMPKRPARYPAIVSVHPHVVDHIREDGAAIAERGKCIRSWRLLTP